MVTVKVRKIRFDPGFCGSKPQGTVTVSANIQSDDLGRLEIGVQVLNQGSGGTEYPGSARSTSALCSGTCKRSDAASGIRLGLALMVYVQSQHSFTRTCAPQTTG